MLTGLLAGCLSGQVGSFSGHAGCLSGVCWLPDNQASANLMAATYNISLQTSGLCPSGVCVCVQAGCPSGLSDWLRGWPLDALLVGVDRLSVDTLVDVVCLGGDCSDVRIQTYTITNSYNKLASVACLPACRCHGGQSSKTNSIRNSRRLAGRQPRGNPGHWPPTAPMAATSRTK